MRYLGPWRPSGNDGRGDSGRAYPRRSDIRPAPAMPSVDVTAMGRSRTDRSEQPATMTAGHHWTSDPNPVIPIIAVRLMLALSGS